MSVIYELNVEPAGEIHLSEDPGYWVALMIEAGSMPRDRGEPQPPTYFWDGGENLVKVKPVQAN